MARYSNPFVQYLSATAAVLDGNKLDFFEPGTTTPKNTFSDSGLTTANPNPVVADAAGRIPDIFLDGTYKVVLKDKNDVTIDTADPVGETAAGQLDAFLNDVTYNIPDLVKGSDNEFYKSLTNSNQGNDPTTSPTNWEQVAIVPLPRGQIDGLITSNGTDSDHDIDTSVGVCVDGTNDILMQLKTVITKQIDANWAPGTNMGGFPSALTLTVDTWYHYFLIAKTDGTVDSGWDTNLSATNLLADATGFTLFRRIASNLTDSSSNILGYTQFSDVFVWTKPILDLESVGPGTSAITVTTSVPLGIRVKADVTFTGSDTTPVGSTLWHLQTPDVEDITPTNATADLFTAIDSEFESVTKSILTNTSSQLTARLSVSSIDHTVRVSTKGWYDFRGKE